MASDTIRQAFSLENAAHRRLVPDFVRRITDRRDTFAAERLDVHTAQHGKIPYKALENTHNSVGLPVFDLFLGSHGEAHADRDLLALEWALHAVSSEPWDDADDDREIALDRLTPLAARFCAYSNRTPRQLAEHWLVDQAGYYADHLAHISMIEQSDVVEQLDRMDATYSFEPGRNHVRIVVPDERAATRIKAMFW